MRYDRSTWERWYLYGKSAGLRTGGTNGEVGSGYVLLSYLTLQPLKMDLIEGSETSAIINQTPGELP